jgi:hypothetical protein
MLVIFCISIDDKRGRQPVSRKASGHPELFSMSVSHVPPSLCDGLDGAGLRLPRFTRSPMAGQVMRGTVTL